MTLGSKLLLIKSRLISQLRPQGTPGGSLSGQDSCYLADMQFSFLLIGLSLGSIQGTAFRLSFHFQKGKGCLKAQRLVTRMIEGQKQKTYEQGLSDLSWFSLERLIRIRPETLLHDYQGE